MGGQARQRLLATLCVMVLHQTVTAQDLGEYLDFMQLSVQEVDKQSIFKMFILNASVMYIIYSSKLTALLGVPSC